MARPRRGPYELPQEPGGKLTEEERRLVARLLSDPTYFPVEFRSWLKNYVESSGMTLPYSQITGAPPP